MTTVVMYGASWCKHCKSGKEFLAEEGIQYRYVDIDEKGLNMSVPVLEVNGQRSVGFSRSSWTNALRGVPRGAPSAPEPSAMVTAYGMPPEMSSGRAAPSGAIPSAPRNRMATLGLYGGSVSAALHNVTAAEAKEVREVFDQVLLPGARVQNVGAFYTVVGTPRSAAVAKQSMLELERRLRDLGFTVQRTPGS